MKSMNVNVKKGALHSQLGVPQSKKMTTAELQSAKHSKSALERKRANFALVARKWAKK